MIKQTPWVERQFNFNYPVTNFPVIFSRLEGSIFRINRIVEFAREEEASLKPEGWSVKEHIGHLTDLEELWWKRLNDFSMRKAVLTAADMANRKTEEAGHNKKTLSELVNAFAVERQRILEAAWTFDAEMLGRTALHPPVTATDARS